MAAQDQDAAALSLPLHQRKQTRRRPSHLLRVRWGRAYRTFRLMRFESSCFGKKALADKGWLSSHGFCGTISDDGSQRDSEQATLDVWSKLTPAHVARLPKRSGCILFCAGCIRCSICTSPTHHRHVSAIPQAAEALRGCQKGKGSHSPEPKHQISMVYVSTPMLEDCRTFVLPIFAQYSCWL